MLNTLEDPALAFVTAFLDSDHCAKSPGISFTEIGPGRASATMTVRQDMLNGHGTCHGGIIFTLADTLFAVAVESILAQPRGIYDITVSCGDDIVAAFRDHARAVDEPTGGTAARRRAGHTSGGEG